jgi:small subunit ribosomal protein S3
MKEREFVKENIRKSEIEEFLNKEFDRAGYSHCEIQKTPLAIRILVFAQRPGMIIGRGGKIIEGMTKTLKEKFGLDNPQLDVQEISNPNLDPVIVGKQIANSIERGINYKRVCMMTIERIIRSGATGVAIRTGGKLGGDKSRFEKFSSGYLKFSGNTAKTLVATAYARAQVKLGTIGIQVRIMTQLPKELRILAEIDKTIKHEIEKKKAEQVEKEVEEIALKEGEKIVEGVVEAVENVVEAVEAGVSKQIQEMKEKQDKKVDEELEEKVSIPEEVVETPVEEKVEEVKVEETEKPAEVIPEETKVEEVKTEEVKE